MNKCYKSLSERGISPRSETPREDLTLEKWKLACDFIESENFKVISFFFFKHLACKVFSKEIYNILVDETIYVNIYFVCRNGQGSTQLTVKRCHTIRQLEEPLS